MTSLWKRAGVAMVAAGLIGLTACAARQEVPTADGGTAVMPYVGTDPITVESVGYPFFTEMYQGIGKTSETITVFQHYPPNYQPGKKYPAVVLIHYSIGPEQSLRWWRDTLAEQGNIVLIPMSNARSAIPTDTRVMGDAYAVLDAVWDDPRIDNSRIGIMGLSKGGTVALYSALNKVHAALAKQPEQKFAYHIAMYPYCGYYPQDMSTTAAPIDIHIGEFDEFVKTKNCVTWNQRYAATGQTNQTFYLYEGTGHMFSHPKLQLSARRAPQFKYQKMIDLPGACTFSEREPGRFYDDVTGEVSTGTSAVHQATVVCETIQPTLYMPDGIVRQEFRERVLRRVTGG